MVASKTGSLFVVMGATGTQGGSVINALLRSSKPYHIRAITRNKTKPAAKTLTEQGVEVAEADAADTKSLTGAFKDAKYVFGMTNFWETADPKVEEANGKAIVDAAKESNIGLLLWSGLANTNAISKGKYDKVYHFDIKAHTLDYAKKSGMPTISVEPGFYASNLVGPMAPKKQEDGSFAMALPVPGSTKVPISDTATDYGLYVQEAVESGAFKPGDKVYAASEYITFEEMVKQWSEVTGKQGKFVQLPREVYKGFFPQEAIGEEFCQMVEFFRDHGYYGGSDIEPSQAHLSQPARKWIDFVKATDWSKVIA